MSRSTAAPMSRLPTRAVCAASASTAGTRAPHHRLPGRALGGGFTLVEVLVALAIVAVALAAGVRAAGSMTQSAERLSDVTAAHWCADNQLTQLRLAQQYPNVGDSAFSCTQLGRSYTGQLQATTTPNPNFRLVSAAVLNAEGQVLVRLSTVMGRF